MADLRNRLKAYSWFYPLIIATWSLISFQDRASPSIEQLIFFHDFTISIITLVTLLVGRRIIFIVLFKQTNRYLLQEQYIEIIWTVVPMFILLSIALPSLQSLYFLDDPFSPNLSVKAIGHQWYWSYEYSDFSGVEFDSYMLPYTLEGQHRLLDTDNSLVLPTNISVRVVTTATDVIHSWAVPALGLKADAVPGRLNQIRFLINRPGIFYGQCREICGANHRFIPIKIEAVPLTVFSNWISSQLEN